MKRLIVPLSLVLACTLNTTLRSEDHPPKKDATREGPIRNFEELDQYVQQIAAREYRTCPPLPEDIDHLSYDEYRMIAFRPEQAIWWNEAPSFWFEMFHRGFVHRNKVSINIATESVEARIPFATKYFEYRGPLAEANIPPDTGFAGLKIVGNFPGHDDGQEMLTFLGASYFRARTADTVYGTSARGLAINAATSGPEEFPAFREFWVVKPKKKQTTLTVLALLESESVTGAYQFELDPGKSRTTLHVQSRLYFRKRPEKIGLAPLTSMWIWGDGLIGPPKDSRPAVHDADGLLILNGEQQWTWRALSRQSYPSLSRIACNDLRGFGLMQRDTDYRHYQDDEAMYHRRPSTWIEPQGSWGAGAVELLELNGAHEGIDNIAAFWVPDEPLPMGQPIDLNYKVHLFRGNLPEHDFLGRAVKTDIQRNDDSIDFAVTFKGKALEQFAPEASLSLEIATVRGSVETRHLRRLANGAWQAMVRVARENSNPESVDPIEIRLSIRDANRTLTETWCYLCAPQPPPYKFPAVYTRIE